jgi:hypothetical protein
LTFEDIPYSEGSVTWARYTFILVAAEGDSVYFVGVTEEGVIDFIGIVVQDLDFFVGCSG